MWADTEELPPFHDGFPRLANIGARSTNKFMFA
jgi:hypothetical protein